MDFYDPEAFDAEDGADEASKQYQTWREVTVFLIDAQPSMFEEAGLVAPGFKPTDTWFSIAMKGVNSILRTKIISSPSDQTAIIFYGTREDQNDNNFKHVYTLQKRETPRAAQIRRCDELVSSGEFKTQIGSVRTNAAEHLRYGLWTVSKELTNAPQQSNKLVYIMTNNTDPTEGHPNAAHITDQVKARMGETQQMGAEFEVLPLTLKQEDRAKFITSRFWSSVLPTTDKLVDDVDAAPTPSFLEGLNNAARYKAFKKRPLRSTRLTFGPDFGIGVQLFATVKQANKAGHIWVSARNHEGLKSEGADLCDDTGAVLTAASMRKRCFPKMTELEKVHFPQVILDIQELEDMRKMGPPGVHVLGFKPMTCLKDYHQLREPTFIYPDEKNLPGSTAAFIAIHGQMLHQGVYAVASSVSSIKQPPKLMALLPTAELVDEESGLQLEPPGMQMVQLPFSDDIRTPESDPSWAGHSHPRADDAAVDAAAKMIEELQLPDYFSGSVLNPALQRHYQVLEALAMGEDAPDQKPEDDQTLPDPALFEQAAPSIQAFKDATYGAGFSGDIDPKAKAPKRKAADMGEAEKGLLAEMDWAGLRAKGKLSTLTVPDLKLYLKGNGLPMSGKKADIIERIEAHLDLQAAK